MRCSVGTFSFIVAMYAVKLLPLTLYFVINQTAPFMTALLAWFWLNESITRCEIVAIVGSYAGVLVMAQSETSSSVSN